MKQGGLRGDLPLPHLLENIRGRGNLPSLMKICINLPDSRNSCFPYYYTTFEILSSTPPPPPLHRLPHNLRSIRGKIFIQGDRGRKDFSTIRELFMLFVEIAGKILPPPRNFPKSTPYLLLKLLQVSV